MIDDKDLTEWERLAAEATPGPWFHDSYSTVHSEPLSRLHDEMEQAIPDDAPEDDPRYAMLPAVDICGQKRWTHHAHPDAAFISASRTAVPALVAEVRRLTHGLADAMAENAALEQVCEERRDRAKAAEAENARLREMMQRMAEAAIAALSYDVLPRGVSTWLQETVDESPRRPGGSSK